MLSSKTVLLNFHSSKDKLVKCYYTQVSAIERISPKMMKPTPMHVSMYTSGGYRYFSATINLPILKVFPLEDGLLLKCVYDPKLVEPTKHTLDSQPDIGYCYVSLTKHPLDDLCIVGMKEGDEIDDMYYQDLLFVSDKLPIAVLFDDEAQ